MKGHVNKNKFQEKPLFLDGDPNIPWTILKTYFKQANIKKIIIKRDINEDGMKYFKTIFDSIDWDLLTQTLSTNDSYNIFLDRFIKICDQAFPEKKIKIKQEPA